MSPAAKRPARPVKSRPVKPWQRAEAGRHRSADERFTLESDGGGRWFVTDSVELDELGLARTSGPFPTLAAAKAAADGVRGRPAATSPLAARMAEAASRPEGAARTEANDSDPRPGAARAARGTSAPGRNGGPAHGPEADPATAPPPPAPALATTPPPPAPAPAQRGWLDDLAAKDAPAATRARALVRRLTREGFRDADALVRRDVLGDRAAIATRLLARDVLAAMKRLEDPSAADLAAAVAGVLASSPKRTGLPGWELVERDGSGERRRPVRLTREDLLAAGKDEDLDAR